MKFKLTITDPMVSREEFEQLKILGFTIDELKGLGLQYPCDEYVFVQQGRDIETSPPGGEVEINSLDELLRFVNTQYKELVVSIEDGKYTLEIVNDWRE